eukprot:COSAG06_NODE_10301_length_1707_cov_2.454596_1_plen_242_part_00
MVRMDVLPRQAPDKHKNESKTCLPIIVAGAAAAPTAGKAGKDRAGSGAGDVQPVNRGCRKCAPNHNSTSCWCNGHMPCYPPTNQSTIVAIAGDYAGIREHNHENHAAYAVWPFRQYAVGKPDLDIGVATYAHRPHPCTHNWCQDVADAAVLGLASDAATQVVGRATAPPLASLDGSARFLGFSQHYEDFAPAVDHLSMMRCVTRSCFGFEHHYLPRQARDKESEKSFSNGGFCGLLQDCSA